MVKMHVAFRLVIPMILVVVARTRGFEAQMQNMDIRIAEIRDGSTMCQEWCACVGVFSKVSYSEFYVIFMSFSVNY